ncbi:MAG: Mor transcription activator family protein [Butyricicoccus sp.]|nr:hypothetical protein [Butyricicoccus pullicaecorum]MDY5972914.1 Mor transcription activator family protein [Butyricicoccus sp.]
MNHSPEKPVSQESQFTELLDLLGETNLRRLCERYGGTSIYIPTATRLERPIRNRRIWREARLGVPVMQLCSRYRLSERQVRRILVGQTVARRSGRAKPR